MSAEAVNGLEGIAVALVPGGIVPLLRLLLPVPARLWVAFMVVGLTGGYLLEDWLLAP